MGIERGPRYLINDVDPSVDEKEQQPNLKEMLEPRY